MANEEEIKDLFKFQLTRHTNRLSKNILNFLEDVQIEQKSSIDRMLKIVPEEYHDLISQSNIFNNEKLERLRKRILDYGGDFVRDMLNEADFYDIQLKNKE